MRYFTPALFATAILFLLLSLNMCESEKPMSITIKKDTVRIIKEKIVEKEVEVIKWKEQKTKIVYKTRFDTLATIDTVFIELIKCDSIVKIDSLIIAKQDTIIKEQKGVIDFQDQEILHLNNDVKKQKRKLFLTSAGAILLSIITILVSK